MPPGKGKLKSVAKGVKAAQKLVRRRGAAAAHAHTSAANTRARGVTTREGLARGFSRARLFVGVCLHCQPLIETSYKHF